MAGVLQESIHPRVYHKTPKKKNTMLAPSKDVTRRKIAAIEEHLGRHPRDNKSRDHLAMLMRRG